jgi:hypothetical protein
MGLKAHSDSFSAKQLSAFSRQLSACVEKPTLMKRNLRNKHLLLVVAT